MISCLWSLARIHKHTVGQGRKVDWQVNTVLICSSACSFIPAQSLQSAGLTPHSSLIHEQKAAINLSTWGSSQPSKGSPPLSDWDPWCWDASQTLYTRLQTVTVRPGDHSTIMLSSSYFLVCSTVIQFQFELKLCASTQFSESLSFTWKNVNESLEYIKYCKRTSVLWFVGLMGVPVDISLWVCRLAWRQLVLETTSVCRSDLKTALCCNLFLPPGRSSSL